jgi:2-phospho-L-lactate/phosphoenolpyruvate guanylyltransferase
MRVALIPMKDLPGAKLRLAHVLTPDTRRELALAMLTDVVQACIDCGGFEFVTVITTDHEVSWHVRELGAKPLIEPATLSGLNESLTFAQRYIGRRMGASELVILPADVPLVRPEDLGEIIEEMSRPQRTFVGLLPKEPTDADFEAFAEMLNRDRGPDGHDPSARVVIVPAEDRGTNALALRPPEIIPMRFGPNSADAHGAEAVAAGLQPIEFEIRRLRFDVDSVADLDAMASMDVGAATRGWLDARAGIGRR